MRWGSDWPVLQLVGSYAHSNSMCTEWLASLDSGSEARVFGGNAQRFYRLEA